VVSSGHCTLSWKHSFEAAAAAADAFSFLLELIHKTPDTHKGDTGASLKRGKGRGKKRGF